MPVTAEGTKPNLFTMATRIIGFPELRPDYIQIRFGFRLVLDVGARPLFGGETRAGRACAPRWPVAGACCAVVGGGR